MSDSPNDRMLRVDNGSGGMRRDGRLKTREADDRGLGITEAGQF